MSAYFFRVNDRKRQACLQHLQHYANVGHEEMWE